jgi:TnpA family transposase
VHATIAGEQQVLGFEFDPALAALAADELAAVELAEAELAAAELAELAGAEFGELAEAIDALTTPLGQRERQPVLSPGT